MKPVAAIIFLAFYLVGAACVSIYALLDGTLFWFIRSLVNRQTKMMRAYIICLPESYRRVLKMYDTFGLKHNSSYLQQTRVRNQVAVMPVEKQCEFVDIVTWSAFPRKPRKNRFVFRFAPGMIRPPSYVPYIPIIMDDQPINMSAISTTAIGNLAWASLYHPDENQRTKATELLADIREYYLGIITSARSI